MSQLTPRGRTVSKRGPKLEAAPPPVIEIQLSVPRERRRALRDALAQAVAGKGGPWRIRVSAKLVYLTPNAGSWWLKVRLTSPQGETFTALLDPEQLQPATVAQAVASAVRGEVSTTACSGCGRIRLEGKWQHRADVKAHARLTHGICPDCAKGKSPGAA